MGFGSFFKKQTQGQSSTNNKAAQNNSVSASATQESEESELLKHVVSTSKTFKITEFENAFFVALEKALKKNQLLELEYTIERKSNGSIRVLAFNGWQMCDIHLRKNIGSILYFTGDGYANGEIHNMNNAPVEATIAVIPYIIKYIKHSKKKYEELCVL